MPRKSMEEEWLNEPEGDPEEEDFSNLTRSPYEGDLPPWGQQGYAGYFPLEAKVFYITAYVGDEPEAKSLAGLPVGTLYGKSVKNVGNLPKEVSFGTEYLYHRIAAVPVRHENLAHAGAVVDHLTKMILRMKLFGKILLEPSFPELPSGGGEMRLPDGRWFPVSPEIGPWKGLEFVNGYVENRLYGGHEEGGWWYDEGIPIASIPIPARKEEAAAQWEAYLTNEAGWSSPYPLSSVLGHDTFKVRVEELFAEAYPSETPHYE